MRTSCSSFCTLLFGLFLSSCTPAPEAHWVVFSSGRTGNGDLYGLAPDTSTPVLLYGTAASESGLRFDAARNRIVHQRYDEGAQQGVLVTGGQDLFVDPTGDVAPVWSPTGTWIAYATREGGQEDLYLAKPDGSGAHRLTNDAEADRYPAWSPDGKQLVFARRLETGWDLHVLQLDVPTSRPVQVTTRGVYVGHPAWSPDGQSIAFDTIFEDGQAEIAYLDVASGEITRLTQRAGNDLVPAWSPDGQKVVFGAEADNAGNWDIWQVEVATRSLLQLTSDAAFDGGPLYVPASALGND